MINFFNNLSETEEQKRQRTDNNQMQTPYNPGQRQMVERVWDKDFF